MERGSFVTMAGELRYEHFTQNENPEKLKAVGRVISKFGVGLKDAMATIDRSGAKNPDSV